MAKSYMVSLIFIMASFLVVKGKCPNHNEKQTCHNNLMAKLGLNYK